MILSCGHRAPEFGSWVRKGKAWQVCGVCSEPDLMKYVANQIIGKADYGNYSVPRGTAVPRGTGWGVADEPLF